jgi:hypothetical protein
MINIILKNASDVNKKIKALCGAINHRVLVIGPQHPIKLINALDAILVAWSVMFLLGGCGPTCGEDKQVACEGHNCFCIAKKDKDVGNLTNAK